MASKGSRKQTQDTKQVPQQGGPSTSLEQLVSKLSDQITDQGSLIKELTATIKDLKQIIVSKDERLAQQDAEIAALKEKLNKNSGNSNKPPSSDFFTKPKPSSINRGKKRKKSSGGQQGHTGSTMKLKETPDVIHQCLPVACSGCEYSHTCESSVVESRQVVDIVIRSEQSRYDRVQRNCPKSGTTLTGAFPEGVHAPQQYGSNLKAMVVSLSSFGMVSASRISEIVHGLTGLHISDGTVCNIIADCAKRCTELLPELRERVRRSAVAHFDETGIRFNSKMYWAHTASTELITLIHAHPKRGVEGVLAGGVLEEFPGVAVHDCWGSYLKKTFDGVTHALCGAHIDRELEGIIQNTRQRWAKSFKRLLRDMYEEKQRLLAQGCDRASPEVIASFIKRYEEILARGFSRNPYPKAKKNKRGRPKKGKVLSFLERLGALVDSVLRFFTDFRVPFSNNIGERSFRLSKLKMKVAGTFRSESGGSNFCTIFSIIDTVRKNGGNPYEALSAIFTNSFSLSFLD